VLEYTAIAAFIATFGLGVARIASNVDSVAWVMVCAFVGYLLADFGTGFIHWFGDTVGSPDWPIVGKEWIGPFRAHHDDQKDITRHGLAELNGTNAMFALPPLAAATFFAPGAPYLCTALASMCFFALITNQLHQWAHMDSPPRIVRAMQRARLILSPEHHNIHHTHPHTDAYCITTGWMNPVLDKLRFFRALEHILVWMSPKIISFERRRDAPILPGDQISRI
jgi:plasmanylethanolamine desaturase